MIDVTKRTATYNAKQRRAHYLSGPLVKEARARHPFCARCGSGEHVQAHHPDYDFPFEVVWLCTRCHVNHHKNGLSIENVPVVSLAPQPELEPIVIGMTERRTMRRRPSRLRALIGA